MLNTTDFEIFYIKELSTRELDLVQKFWKFDNQSDLTQFCYPISKLNIEFKDLLKNKSDSVSNLIPKLSFISSLNLVCADCKEPAKFTNRGGLSFIKSKDDFICEACHQRSIENQLLQRINSLEVFVDTFKFPENNFDLDALSYIESVYLSIISRNCDSYGLVKIEADIVSEQRDYVVLTKLQEKGYIFLFDRSLEIGSNLYDDIYYIDFYSKQLSPDLKLKYSFLLSRIPNFGMYLLARNEDSYKKNYDKNLTNTIQRKKTISIDEVKEIEDVIREILQNRSIGIVNAASKYYNFYSKKDEAFKSILNYACWNYSMRRVCSIIFYAAKNLAAEIQAREIHPATLQLALRKKVENYINYLDENQDAKLYSKDIPDNIAQAKLTSFITANLFYDVLGWDGLSGKEILNKWVSEVFENSDS